MFDLQVSAAFPVLCGNPRSLPKGPLQRPMRFEGSLNPNRICAAYKCNRELGRVGNGEFGKCSKFEATPRANSLGLLYLESMLVLEQDQAPESLRESFLNWKAPLLLVYTAFEWGGIFI